MLTISASIADRALVATIISILRMTMIDHSLLSLNNVFMSEGKEGQRCLSSVRKMETLS
uniref:Uncharacterized protein n=1 Tax=Rhizobium rhizogenes TaxID=359 RepID=A0A7S5DRH9_RHIRH|nr:hypothetical protein pC5.8a_209 [Rhizobium rhizogenes]